MVVEAIVIPVGSFVLTKDGATLDNVATKGRVLV